MEDLDIMVKGQPRHHLPPMAITAMVAMEDIIMAKDQLMHHPNHMDTVDTTVAMEDMVITDMVVAMDMAIMAKDQLMHHPNHTDTVDTTVAMEDMAITVMVAM